MSQTTLPTPGIPAVSTSRRAGPAALTLAAIGIVYGDIGTSPLYTVKEIFAPSTGIPLDAPHLVGAISVIVWALMLVVTLKYVILILRADNSGEGGGLALTALAAQAVAHRPVLRSGLLLLGIFGAALFYGDSVITPAISVLGAMEGLKYVAPALETYAVPITVLILIALFSVQQYGTARVGRWFGPIIVFWFVTLGAIGIVHITREPAILAALNPMHAWHFLMERGWHVFVAIGAIVLALTGAEALYADMGHFGRKPIQLAWTGLVFPGLALNYLGQGALLMADPSAIDNPFYRLFPAAWALPVLALATLAAIIASQAVISGAYSLTKQAIQLGFLPRMSILNTSEHESGQIYMPAVSWTLLAGVVAAVVFFGSSSALAGAYGIAVTLTMLITTILTYFVVRHAWSLPAPVAIGATAFFLLVDAMLVAGTFLKFLDGGWFPLALGLVLFILMSTWSRGRTLLLASIRHEGLELMPFIETLDVGNIHRAQRTAIYPVSNPSAVPLALLHNMKHNQVLHAHNIILTVVFRDVPWVPSEQRVEVTSIGAGFWQVNAHFGFMDVPDVPKAMSFTKAYGLSIPPFETSYFLSRETVVPLSGEGMVRWREKLFAVMSNNAGGVVDFFRLPGNAVVELGTRIQI